MSKPVPPVQEEIRETRLSEALSERYLAYALSTIVSRSLPDVRDGLKPVHRRLLYAMRQLKLNPETGFKKCARVVGDVIGKYHPHGEQAVYDAMVRLAQEFAVRYPLVEGQGNFGNLDGDNAAAMRYTEARMTSVAIRLLQGIDEDAVDFRPTYDGEEDEPMVLPAAFPNLLANGASGIAVGMATSIPPHNVAEICDALRHLIKNGNASVEKLVSFMPGPDFPTGGVLMEDQASLVEAYTTGRGNFRLRARWEEEKLSRGLYQIIVTEIPYQVQKAKLIERIADLLNTRKLPLLADIRDESTEDVRIVLEPRNRSTDPAVLMEQIYRLTDMEVRISLNMNVLDAGNTPMVMDLRQVLQAFLNHRHEVLVRRSQFRRDKIIHRLEILGGYLIAYLNLDEVIRIIREEDESKRVLMATFGLSDVQAEAILNMRLRRLRKLEEMEIRTEHEGLSAELSEIEALLADETLRWRAIDTEIKELSKEFGRKTPLGRRRTDFGTPPEDLEIPVEALVEKEPITILCSEKGWIRAAKGHQLDPDTVRYKEGDEARFMIKAMTTDRLLVFTSDGRFFTLGCDKLPGGRGHGEPLRLMIEMGPGVEPVSLFVHQPGRGLVIASSGGRGFLVKEDDVIAQTRNGKQILNLAKDETARICYPVTEQDDHVAVLGENRRLLIFPLEELPAMTRGKGVILQRYNSGGLADAKTFRLEDGLSWPMGERTRTETKLGEWLGHRAQTGRQPPHGFPRTNKF